MDLSIRTSPFGRYDFIIRRLHSLTGLFPVGAYLFIHLATNASILDGAKTYQSRVDQIHSVGPTTLFFLEWACIFTPLLFHGIAGMMIVLHGNRNLGSYTYTGNFRYTLQRWTGVIAMFFVLYHVFHMHGWFRFNWWAQHVAAPLGGARFDAGDAAVTAAVAIRSSALVGVLYAIGILASVYHLANGLWTSGITWGLWTTPRAQRWANIPCAGFGVVLAVLGIASLVGVYFIDVPPEALHRSGSGHRSVDARALPPGETAMLPSPTGTVDSLEP